MIATYLYDGQGLGNQLWSYYALRLIAKKLQISFALLGAEKFKASSFINIHTGRQIKAPLRNTPKNELFPPFVNYFSEKQIVHADEYCDVRGFDERCLLLSSNTLIDGYFQSEELADQVEHCINDFFLVKNIPKLDYLGSDDICLLNIRGGEYKRNKRLTVHKKYWDNAMSYMTSEKSVNEFLIVTDDIGYARSLFPKIKILDQNMHHDFVALMKAKKIIVSNSSFAYFPLRLNRQRPYIIAPKYWARHNVSDGYWACRSNIYRDYWYMDREGKVYDHKICLREADEFIKKYSENFFVEKHTYAARHPNFIKSFIRNRVVKYA